MNAGGFLPTNEDLTGVAEALLRLQDTYALQASQISGGDLHPGLEDTARLSGIRAFPCKTGHLFVSSVSLESMVGV